MAEEITTLVLTVVPRWIRDQRGEAIYDAVKRTIKHIKPIKLLSCPNLKNLRVEFYSVDDATYVKEAFDLIEMDLKLIFSEYNLSSQKKQAPQITFSSIQRDVHLDLYVAPAVATNPPWFNGDFPLQEEIGRDSFHI